ncbi:hypothetical protein [Entomobacter blattae]|nr:hypothetical protein [Entomobacter blattae]
MHGLFNENVLNEVVRKKEEMKANGPLASQASGMKSRAVKG